MLSYCRTDRLEMVGVASEPLSSRTQSPKQILLKNNSSTLKIWLLYLCIYILETERERVLCAYRFVVVSRLGLWSHVPKTLAEDRPQLRSAGYCEGQMVDLHNKSTELTCRECCGRGHWPPWTQREVGGVNWDDPCLLTTARERLTVWQEKKLRSRNSVRLDCMYACMHRKSFYHPIQVLWYNIIKYDTWT